jgi:hypothetical protein
MFHCNVNSARGNLNRKVRRNNADFASTCSLLRDTAFLAFATSVNNSLLLLQGYEFQMLQ